MLEYLRDQWSAARLRAKYQRLVQQRLLELTESSSRALEAEESSEWRLLGGSKGEATDWSRTSTRDRARRLVRENPHACNILRLLEAYVVGPGLKLTHQPACEKGPDSAGDVAAADTLWQQFLDDNQGHYSFREHARRTWRDGECFLRKFSTEVWPPAARFIDPELIGGAPGDPDSQGILCDSQDQETPVVYLRLDPRNGELAEEIPAGEIRHSRLGVDSNEKRGVSFFRPLLDPLASYEKWLETEMLARKLQSSIVLWRKVQGSGGMAEALADRVADGGGGRDSRRERFAPGSILTTSHGTEIQFLQPNTNFGDAVPLGRMLLLAVAAGAGLPEFMLTADAANANFASTMMAEGPAVKFFESQQRFFAAEFTGLWRWVMAEAIERGLLPGDFLSQVSPTWTFPPLVNRDRPKERLADVRLLESGVLSRAEVARRDGVDPALMDRERAIEVKRPHAAPRGRAAAGKGRAS